MARGHEDNNNKLANMNNNAHTSSNSGSSSSNERDTPQSNDTPAKDIADITLLERVTAARFNRIVDPAIAREEARNIGKGVALCDRSTILTEEHEARDRAEAAAKGLDSYDTRETEAGLLEPVRPDPLPLPAETDPRAVVMLLVGKTPREVSDTLDIPLETLLTLADHPSMLGACQSIRDNLLQDILHGTHGPIAMARAASNEMVSHVIGLARRPAQPEVQRKSAIDILAIAGYGPTKRIETVNMNEWWSDMTPEEVRHYARTREWPARFADLVTRPLPIKKVEKEGR